MPFDDDAAEPTGCRPPPHPDDRLWRHPSELATSGARSERARERRLPWGAIAAAGTASVVLAAGVALVVGVRSPTVDGGLTQQAGVTPLVSDTTATTSTLVTPTSTTFLDADQVQRLGIEVHDAPSGGVAVAAVDPEGPAADSGLQAEDVIVDVDGTPVTDLTTLTGVLSDRDPGDEVDVTFQPSATPDEPITVQLTVGDLGDLSGN